jgi:hypothetical protein
MAPARIVHIFKIARSAMLNDESKTTLASPAARETTPLEKMKRLENPL